jgi:hypothetical protein
MFRRYKNFLRLAFLVVAPVLASGVSHATNLVQNGSFESFTTGWTIGGAYSMHVGKVSAQGTNYITIDTNAWQDIATTPGETYYIRFAVQSTNLPGVYRRRARVREFAGHKFSRNPSLVLRGCDRARFRPAHSIGIHRSLRHRRCASDRDARATANPGPA